MRPKVFDSESKQWVLLDSGSCVSCYPAGPNDVQDPSFKLRSVNGGQIDTFGTKKMTLRIGRKTYCIDAVVAAVPAPIFGWDLFHKYHLTLDWNEKNELVICDKKAQISSVLQNELVTAGSIPRICKQNNDVNAAYFELQCMQRLDKFINSIEIGHRQKKKLTQL